MRTVGEIRELLKEADRQEYDVLSRALSADTRKGVARALEAARRRLDAQEAEERRLAGLYLRQREIAGGRLLMGLDEVGRGPLAGPLTVAAVVLPEEPFIAGLNDSKRVSPESRVQIAAEVRKRARAWTIQHAQPAEIDALGMARALRSTFGRAIEAIDEQLPGVQVVLVDGNPLHIDSREVNVVKGDAACASIAAASIIAKVERDAIMVGYARDYPEYGFELCKGYGSAAHMDAIRANGLCPIHRRSFCHFYQQDSLF